jgi:uncharacterized protein
VIMIRTFIVSAIVAAGTVFSLTDRVLATDIEIAIPAAERSPLTAKLRLPDGDGPFPTLIVAPGRGYDMERVLTADLAGAATASGFASLRFNWRFQGSGGTGPSEGLVTEVQDLEEVVAFARADARMDAERLFLAGKSMGSIVSYRVSSKNPGIQATYLLTPICRQLDETGGNSLYPKLLQSDKPIVLALGNRDPLCPLPNLYRWLGSANENIVTIVFGGDHGLRLASGTSDVATLDSENEQLAIQAVVHWLKIHLGELE